MGGGQNLFSNFTFLYFFLTCDLLSVQQSMYSHLQFENTPPPLKCRTCAFSQEPVSNKNELSYFSGQLGSFT